MADRGLVEPLTGIEPAPPAWKAGVLPLNYSGMVPGHVGAYPGGTETEKRGNEVGVSPWSSRSGSNRRPAGYKSAALPTELQERIAPAALVPPPGAAQIERSIFAGLSPWRRWEDSNLRPTVLETVALPTELQPYILTARFYQQKY